MTAFDVTPNELLAISQRLVDEPDPATAGLWARATALLARQAIELALDDFWITNVPGIEDTSARVQLICLPVYLENEELAERTNHVWWILTRAVHHHPYELAPTATELREWLDEAAAVVKRLGERETSAVASE